MLTSDWAQKQTSIRICRRTGSLIVLSPGLSCPFLKTLAAFFPDPTDQPVGRRNELIPNERNFTLNRFLRVECR